MSTRQRLFVFVLILLLSPATIYAKDYEVKKKVGEYNVEVKIDKNPPIVGDNNMEIEIKDGGKGFDYVHLPSPIEKENLEKPSQRGIFLMQHMMDKVEFLDGGSRIKMLKLLSRGKGA